MREAKTLSKLEQEHWSVLEPLLEEKHRQMERICNLTGDMEQAAQEHKIAMTDAKGSLRLELKNLRRTEARIAQVNEQYEARLKAGRADEE